MNKTILARPVSIVILLLSVGLLAWSAIRSSTLSMTIDEGHSLLNHVPDSVFNIFFSRARFDSANNHVLNTLSMKFFTALFGYDEWAVRLSSVLSHLLYLIFSWRLVRLISTNPLSQLTGFVLLNVNLFMLDFFSVARGYAMANALMLAAIFYTFRSQVVENQRDRWLAAGSTFLSIAASFIQLNFLLVWWAVLNIGAWAFSGRAFWLKNFWKLNLPPTVVAASVALVFGQQIGWLRQLDEFKNGCDSLMTTFKEAVAASMLHVQYFKTGTDVVAIFTDIVFYTLVVVLFGGFLMAFFPQKNRKPFGLLGLLYFGLMLVGFLVQFHFLGTKFLFARTSLIVFPLAGLAVWLFLDELDGRLARFRGGSAVMQVVLFAFAFFPVYHAIRARHFEGTREWYFDETTKDMCQFMAETAQKRQKSVDLMVYWAYFPSTTYYQKQYFSKEINPIRHDDGIRKDSLYEFYYLEDRDLPKLNPAYKTLKIYGGWRYLMQRKSN